MRRGMLFAAVGVVCAAPVRAQIESPGTLTLVRGVARVERLVRSEKVALPVPKRLRLQLGDRIVLPPGAAAEVMHYASGKRYSLGPGEARVDAQKVILPLPKPHEAAVLAQTSDFRIAAGPVGNARKGLSTIGRGVDDGLFAPEPFGAVSEAGDIVLRWKSEPAGKLLLTLRRQGERDPILAEALAADATSFTLPADRIEAGTVYFWQLEDTGRPTRSLRTLPLWRATDDDRRARQALETAAAALRAQKRPIEADMALADGLQNLGWLADALAVWRKVAAAEPDNPDHGEQVRRLVRMLHLPK